MGELVLLKLGGSLITDKQTPFTPRRDVLERLCGEIRQAQQDHPELRLIIGHGSGSFGHVPAKKYGTRQGVRTPEQWRGFVEVWKEARALNQIVLEALLKAGVLAIGFPPSGSVLAEDGQVLEWPLGPLTAALVAGLTPVINGDVIFDTRRGGTILSTEDLFVHLAKTLRASRILLAGLEPGVWEDYPANSRLVPVITTGNYEQVLAGLKGSAAVDVTGGMEDKVRRMLDLVRQVPDLKVSIFSGMQPGRVRQALSGELTGTIIE